MAGLNWNAKTKMAEWDDDKETPTEMCDRLIDENEVGPRRGQAIAAAVRSLVFTNIRKLRDIPLSLARRELLAIVSSDLECNGFKPMMSDNEKDLASYIFDRLIADGWHTLDPNGRPSVYIEPRTFQGRQVSEPVAVRVESEGLSLGVKVGLFLVMYGLIGFNHWVNTGESPNVTAILPAAVATFFILGFLWLLRELRGLNDKKVQGAK